jgi:hypothetical protein
VVGMSLWMVCPRRLVCDAVICSGEIMPQYGF